MTPSVLGESKRQIVALCVCLPSLYVFWKLWFVMTKDWTEPFYKEWPCEVAEGLSSTVLLLALPAWARLRAGLF